MIAVVLRALNVVIVSCSAPQEGTGLGAETPKPALPGALCLLASYAMCGTSARPRAWSPGLCWLAVSSTRHSARHLDFCSVIQRMG